MKATSKPTRRTEGTPSAGRQGTAAAGPRTEDIAVAAYYKAAQRGFAPGFELTDWLEAEREISQLKMDS